MQTNPLPGAADSNYSIFDPQVGLDENLQREQITTQKIGGSSLLPNGIANPNLASTLTSGEMPSLIGYGKFQFSDTNAGWLQGLDTDNKFKWFIGDATSSADWNVTAPNTFTIKGAITATTGTIGGFVIGADFIRDLANSFGLASTVTAGDDVRFWAGSTFANRSTAKFRLTEGGVMTLTDNANYTIILTGGTFAQNDSGGTNIVGFSSVAGAICYIRPNTAANAGLTVFNYSGIAHTGASAPIASALVSFKVFNSSSSSTTLYTENVGSGATITATSGGSGKALVVNKQSGSGNTGIELNHATNGGIALEINKIGANGYALRINNSNSGYAFYIQNDSSSSNYSFFMDHNNNNRMVELQQNLTTCTNVAFTLLNRGVNSALSIVDVNAGSFADGIFIGYSGFGNYIYTSTGAKLTNAGVWTNASSRTLKENFKPVEYDILEKLKTLEVPLYTYITEARRAKADPTYTTPRHLTPMAEDFNEMFGLGDNKSISAADIAGVALVAIQQLLKKLNI